MISYLIMYDDIMFDDEHIIWLALSEALYVIMRHHWLFQAANLLIYTKKDSMDVKVASGDIKRRCEVWKGWKLVFAKFASALLIYPTPPIALITDQQILSQVGVCQLYLVKSHIDNTLSITFSIFFKL